MVPVVGERLLVAGDRLVAQGVEHFLAQAGDQHPVLAAQVFHRAEQFFVVLVAQVGYQNHQARRRWRDSTACTASGKSAGRWLVCRS